MRQPMVSLAVVFVAGILAGEFLTVSPEVLLPVGFVAGLAAIPWPRARSLLLWAGLFVAGWAAQGGARGILCPVDLRLAAPAGPCIVTLQGTLLASPVCRRLEWHGTSSLRTSVEIEAQWLNLAGRWRPVTGRVRTSTPGALGDGFFEGATVQVEGVLQDPSRPAAEGLFDYRAYLARRGVYHQLDVASVESWGLTGRGVAQPVADRFRAWGMATLSRGLPAQDASLELLWAMVLGWTTGLTDEVAAPFMESGTMHVFAVSGLHIALIAGILVALFRVCQVPRRVCGWVVLPALWFYTAATGWQPSAIRSSLMMSVVIGGWALRRPGDLVNSLAASAFLILAFDPQQLFQASFQLSFFVVLSIALLLPALEAWRDRWLAPDPFLPPDALPLWRRHVHKGVRRITTSVGVSLAAWLGSLPLIAAFFHLFTPVSLLANLLIVPLSGLALTSALGSLVCGSWFSAAGVLFNSAGWFWMELMVRLSRWFADMPGGCFHVASPNAALTVLYYGSLVGLLLVRRAGPWLPRALAGAWTFFLVGTGLCAWFQRDVTKITVLSLGGGDALVAEGCGLAGGLVIDGGNGPNAAAVTAPFLQSRGWNHIGQLLLSHGDVRHIGGHEILSERFPPRTVIGGPIRFRSPAYRQAVEQAAARHRFRAVDLGDRVGCWTVVHPASGDRFQRADDGVLVLLGDLGGVRVLLCSDLGRLGQRTLLARHAPGELSADIVIAGIPDDGEPLGDALLEAVRPGAIVLSSGKRSSRDHARRPLKERLAAAGVPVFYTDRDGSVTLRVGRGGWEVRSMEGRRVDGRIRAAEATGAEPHP